MHSSEYSQNRQAISLPVRERVFDKYGYLCAYCCIEIATEMDHLLPYVLGGSDDEDNLVASCQICNQIARAYFFDSLDKKREFILNQRKAKKWQVRISRNISTCSTCGAIFSPRSKGSTKFLCVDCANKYT